MNAAPGSSDLPSVLGPFETHAQCLVDFTLWPGSDRLDFYGWFSNFADHERPYAIQMLSAFMFYNEGIIDGLLRAAVTQISTELTRTATSLPDAQARWKSFLGSVVVTYVEGEQPNATDSGHLFARKARQVLAIEQDQILAPGAAAQYISEHPTAPLLLLDDFVGSGNQMSFSWTRQHAGPSCSFSDLSDGGSTIYYAPLVVTKSGLNLLEMTCSHLLVRPAHVIDERYKVTNPDAHMWPPNLRDSVVDVLYSASQRAGIVDHCEFGWEGFHDLALPLAFFHSTPDATLPLFHWEKNGWKPLVRIA